MKIWDAIVVGAGPAGCACAYDLASSGKSVLLLDKADFPRVKACAGGLTMKTVRALRYSVEPVVRQTISKIVLEERDTSRVPVRSRKSICVMTVRAELDAYCLKKTIEAGASFKRISGLGSITQDEDGVTVAAYDTVFRGRFLIGADGVNSQVRRMTGDAPWFKKGLAIEVDVRRNASGDDLVFDFAPVAQGYGWVFPKYDHVNIGLYSIDSNEDLSRGRVAAYVAHRFGVEAKTEKFIGQYVGFGAAQFSGRSGRVLLVGDAGGFVDPLTGEGIYGAITSGQAAAKAITGASNDGAVFETFLRLTSALRQNLRIAERVAVSFYSNPERGFRAMKMPLLRSAILKSYADGFNLSGLVNVARRVLPRS